MTTGRDKQLLDALWSSNIYIYIYILMLEAKRNEFLSDLY